MGATPNLTSGQFTIGPNNSVAVFSNGSEQNIGLLTEINWMSKTRIQKTRVNLMSGYSFDLPFLQGWEGELTIQRTDNSLDTWWYTQVETPMKSGLPYPNLNIMQTVRETDGTTITQFNFQGAILYYDDAGAYENESGVVQRLSFVSPVRIVTTN